MAYHLHFLFSKGLRDDAIFMRSLRRPGCLTHQQCDGQVPPLFQHLMQGGGVAGQSPVTKGPAPGL